jgi:hypothetical protein
MVSILRPQLTLPVRIHPITPIQSLYYHDRKHRFFVLPPGRRSRKTLLSFRRVLLAALRNAKHRYFLGAPTRPQAKAIFWKRLKAETQAFWAKQPNESELFVTLLNGTEIHVVGLERPQRIEGQPWHGGHISEFDDLKTGAWESNIRPVLSDTHGFCILDGVPEGRKHLYDLALYACDGAIPKTQAGVGSFVESKADPEWCYYHWFSADVLPPAEIDAARRTLDPKMFAQEYEGSFEAFDGLAYHAANGANYIDGYRVNPTEPVIVAMDFNYSPMCSTLLQKTNIDGKEKVVAFKANAFQNCSTEAACERIIDETGENLRYIVYPDPACQNRAAHGVGVSDLGIINEVFSRRAKGGFWINVKPAAPKRKDRLNAVNAMLRNAKGEARLLIVRSECKALVKDFEKCGMEEFLNGHFKDPSLGHASDGLGYFIDHDYPLEIANYEALTRM